MCASSYRAICVCRQYSKACFVIWSPDELKAPVKAAHAAKGASRGAEGKAQSNKRKAAGTAKV